MFSFFFVVSSRRGSSVPLQDFVLDERSEVCDPHEPCDIDPASYLHIQHTLNDPRGCWTDTDLLIVINLTVYVLISSCSSICYSGRKSMITHNIMDMRKLFKLAEITRNGELEAFK